MRQCLGPALPGLPVLESRESAFDEVIEYRAYRLLDTRTTVHPNEIGQIGRKAGRLRMLLPLGTQFHGDPPIGILSFLSEVKRGCDQLDIHEGMATTLLHYFLGAEPQPLANCGSS